MEERKEGRRRERKNEGWKEGEGGKEGKKG